MNHNTLRSGKIGVGLMMRLGIALVVIIAIWTFINLPGSINDMGRDAANKNWDKGSRVEIPLETASDVKPVRSGCWEILPRAIHRFVFDPARNCLWATVRLAGKAGISRYELSTGLDKMMTTGQFSSGSIALNGDHLWLGGHNVTGPGLFMYDISSGSLLQYTKENTQGGLPGDDVTVLWAEKGVVWLCGPFGLVRFAHTEKDSARKWTWWRTRAAYSGGPPVQWNSRVLSTSNLTFLPYDGNYLVYHNDLGAIRMLDPGTSAFRDVQWPLTHEPNELRFASPPEEHELRRTKYRDLKDPGERQLTLMSGGTIKAHWWARDFMSRFVALRGDDLWIEVALQEGLNEKKFFLMRFNLKTSAIAFVPLQWGLGARCVDNDECWYELLGDQKKDMGSLGRLKMRTGQVTAYSTRQPEVQLGQSAFWQVAAAGDSVFVVCEHGLRRMRKSSDYPMVVDSLPKTGESAVPPGTLLSVSFSLPMSERTLNEKTIQLFVNGALVRAGVACDAGSKKALISPASPIPSGMDCELRLSSFVQAANGNPLADTVIRFRTK